MIGLWRRDFSKLWCVISHAVDQELALDTERAAEAGEGVDDLG